MFLKKNSLNILKNQYLENWKYSLHNVMGLCIVQFVAVIISIFGSSAGSAGSDSFSLEWTFVSTNILLILTLVGLSVITFIHVSNERYNFRFIFCTNRVLYNLSNIGFIISIAFLFSLTAKISEYLLRIFLFTESDYYISSSENLLGTDNLLKGFWVIFVTSILISSITYLFKTILIINGILVKIVSLFLFITPFIVYPNIIKQLLLFFKSDGQAIYYSIKVLLISIVFYITSVILANRMEVRK